MHPQIIEQTGIVNEIDFDARYEVKGYRGIAFYLLGYPTKQTQTNEDQCEQCEPEMETNYVVAVMVGDDRRHYVPTQDLTKINDEDYCPSCGQIGCKHGRS